MYERFYPSPLPSRTAYVINGKPLTCKAFPEGHPVPFGLLFYDHATVFFFNIICVSMTKIFDMFPTQNTLRLLSPKNAWWNIVPSCLSPLVTLCSSPCSAVPRGPHREGHDHCLADLGLQVELGRAQGSRALHPGVPGGHQVAKANTVSWLHR